LFRRDGSLIPHLWDLAWSSLPKSTSRGLSSPQQDGDPEFHRYRGAAEGLKTRWSSPIQLLVWAGVSQPQPGGVVVTHSIIPTIPDEAQKRGKRQDFRGRVAALLFSKSAALGLHTEQSAEQYSRLVSVTKAGMPIPSPHGPRHCRPCRPSFASSLESFVPLTPNPTRQNTDGTVGERGHPTHAWVLGASTETSVTRTVERRGCILAVDIVGTNPGSIACW